MIATSFAGKATGSSDANWLCKQNIYSISHYLQYYKNELFQKLIRNPEGSGFLFACCFIQGS